MNKSFILLVCFLGLSFLYQASAAAPRECDIGFYDVPAPPVCTWVTGPDGEQYEQCTATGSAAYAAVLDKDESSIPKTSFALNDIEWSGYCKCTLTLYSTSGNKTYWINYPFSNSKDKHVYANKIWKRTTNAFKVVCAF